MNSSAYLNKALEELGWSVRALSYEDEYYLFHRDCGLPVDRIDGLFLAISSVDEIAKKVETTMRAHRCWLDLMFEFNGATLGWLYT